MKSVEELSKSEGNGRPKELLHAKILLVDDEEGNRNVLERMLRKMGYTKILSAANGQECLEKFDEEHPDLVLLDLKMPNLDGFDVMRQLKADNENDYLPILVLTAQLDRETRLAALKSGAKDFITKPIELPEILARINNMLEVRLLHKQVRDQNKNLEERVIQRTLEMQKTRMDVIHRLGRAS